ncbi:MAG: hypothetical protein NVS3B24_12800 [Candidatus Dormibacteria bacterium]
MQTLGVKILLVEDSAEVAQLTVEQLRHQGLEVEWEHVQATDEFAGRLDSSFDAVIADYHVPGAAVRTVLAMTRERFPDLPFLVISAAMSADEGVELMRLGAQDYLSKRRLQRLGPSLIQCVARARERQQATAETTRYRSLFARLPGGVARSTPTGETLEIDTALLHLLGYPDEAAYRWDHASGDGAFISAEARAEIGGLLGRTGRLVDYQTQVRRHDGSLVWVRLDMIPVRGEDGELTSYDTLVVDIDDQHRALEELRWSESQRRMLLKHDGAGAERTRIAQGIHDDAVQVMSATNIHLAILGRKLSDPKLRAEVDRLIDAVGESSARLRDLIFELQPPALEVSGLAAALRDQLARLQRDAAIDVKLTGHLAQEPDRDRGMLLYRIAQEAFANIRKHAEATRVDVAISTADDGVLLRIHDDGRGFSPRAPGDYMDPGHIGLASIVERPPLVEGWGRVESSPGAGTTVTVWVPGNGNTDSPAGAPTHGPAGPDAIPPKMSAENRKSNGIARVLIVEDHPLVAQALLHLLQEAEDLTVVGVANDGADAVRQAMETHPDVVLMDYHLPGQSGAYSVAEIRSSAPATFFLFLSADDTDSALLAAVEAGASGYLSKATRPELVLDAVRRVAAGETLIPAAVLTRLISSKRTAVEHAEAESRFTPREREVLKLMSQGLDSASIAQRLGIQLSTVRFHVRSILGRLQAHTQLEAVALAAELGLLDR